MKGWWYNANLNIDSYMEILGSHYFLYIVDSVKLHPVQKMSSSKVVRVHLKKIKRLWTAALWIPLEFIKLNFQCNILCPSFVSITYILLQDLYKTPPHWAMWPSEILPGAQLQPLFPLPYIIAENNSPPKQTGKCLMILYPSMSSWCQWNIVPWAHISFLALSYCEQQRKRPRNQIQTPLHTL